MTYQIHKLTKRDKWVGRMFLIFLIVLMFGIGGMFVHVVTQ